MLFTGGSAPGASAPPPEFYWQDEARGDWLRLREGFITLVDIGCHCALRHNPKCFTSPAIKTGWFLGWMI